MNVRRLVVFLLFFVLAAQLWPVWHVSVDEATEPGGHISVYVRSADPSLHSVVATVEHGRSIVCANDGVDLTADHESGRTYASLLAVPSTATYLEVIVRVSGQDATGQLEYIGYVQVVPRRFRRENIPLDSRMSDLRRSDQEQIAEQSRLLWKLLMTRRSEVDERVVPHSFRYPLESIRYTSYFGDQRMYQYADGTTDSSRHNGIDFGGATGTPVLAPGSGTVVFSGDRIITGGTVIIEHFCGVYSLYYHLDTRSVSVGSRVNDSTQIGTVGATGLVTGPHLHWEMRVGGIAVDPERFIVEGFLDKRGAFIHIIP